jgi:hypothetical protein
VYVTAGDIYYLYLILKKRPVVSFTDALTVDNVQYRSFQQAAVAAGYVTDRKEALECYKNVAEKTLTPDGDVHLTPANLRALFCHLTIEGFPTREIFDTPELLRYMLTDYLDNGMNTSQVCTYTYVIHIHTKADMSINVRLLTGGFRTFKITSNETIKLWNNTVFLPLK